MKTVGIIAEYNPFHNGHKFHIEESRRLTGADCVVAVMSGNFVQRGEPAIFNKWMRAEAAVRSGADLVIELPTVFACATAEVFAEAGVRLLSSLGSVDYIAFGAEEESLEKLQKVAELFAEESGEFKDEIKRNLKNGMSFAAARASAAEAAGMKECGEIIRKPNNILAVEYLKQLKLLEKEATASRKTEEGCATDVANRAEGTEKAEANGNSGVAANAVAVKAEECRNSVANSTSGAEEKAKAFVKAADEIKAGAVVGAAKCGSSVPLSIPKPALVVRKSAGYYEENPNECMAGAGKLRDMLRDGLEIDRYLPECSRIRENPCFSDSMFEFLEYKLLTESPERLGEIDGAVEGLENRAIKAASEAIDMESLINMIKSKRYSRTAVQRMLTRMLLGITKEEMAEFRACRKSYARVLAFSEKGSRLMRQIKKDDNENISLITNINKERVNDDVLKKMLEYDVKAGDLYDLLCYGKPGMHSDHRMKPFMSK